MRIPDLMTPLERRKGYFRGEEVDRLPFNCLGIETGCSLFHTDPRVCYHSVEAGLYVQQKLVEEYHVDSVGCGPNLKGIAEALGTEIGYPKWGICYVKEPILGNYDDLDRLRDIDFLHNKRLPGILTLLERMKERYGNTHCIGNSVAGPLTTASAIRGTEKLLKDMVRNKEKLHELLEFTVEVNVKWVKYVWDKCGVEASVSDPVASADLLSLERFREFAEPYLTRMCSEIRKITGKRPSLHICGKTKPLWKELAGLGIGGFSLDNREKLKDFKLAVGDTMSISGNVDPAGVMKLGTPDDVREAVIRCILEGSDSPKGFIIGAGCQMPPGISKENLRTYVESVERYGRGAKMGRLCEGIADLSI